MSEPSKPGQGERPLGLCWLLEFGHGLPHPQTDKCSHWVPAPAQSVAPPQAIPEEYIKLVREGFPDSAKAFKDQYMCDWPACIATDGEKRLIFKLMEDYASADAASQLAKRGLEQVHDKMLADVQRRNLELALCGHAKKWETIGIPGVVGCMICDREAAEALVSQLRDFVNVALAAFVNPQAFDFNELELNARALLSASTGKREEDGNGK